MDNPVQLISEGEYPMIQTIWARWNEAIVRMVRQPSLAGGGSLFALAPPTRRKVQTKTAAQSGELSDHLKREFARIRDEERNILDTLIMLD
jgi:hypothetical protein